MRWRKTGVRTCLGLALGLTLGPMTGCGSAQEQTSRVPPPVPVGGPTEAMTPQPRPPAPGGTLQDPATRDGASPFDAAPPKIAGSPLRLRWISVIVADKDLQIEAPEGADVRRIGGVTTVNFGAGFSVEIRKIGEDLATLRDLAMRNPAQPSRGVVLQADDAFVYLTAAIEPGRPEAVSFVAVRDLGSDRYSCQNTQGYGHDRRQVDRMLQACRTLTLERGPTEAF